MSEGIEKYTTKQYDKSIKRKQMKRIYIYIYIYIQGVSRL